MEQLLHFTHDHMLNLVHLQPNHDNKNENSDEEEEEKEEGEEDDFVAEEKHVGQCKMCKEGIYSFHMSYYECKDCDDDYSLHKICAEMPKTLQNHPSHDPHPDHNLTLSEGFQRSDDPYFTPDSEWTCGVCNLKRKNLFNYHCSICGINMDIICATMSQQKMDHPSHPHQLQRMPKKMVSCCNACGEEHQGTFYHCTTCFCYSIHLDCALLPAKLLIQQHTDATFTHSHPLTLAYSFPRVDRAAKYYPKCRVCMKGFYIYFWLYKCDKCQYYVHINCATSKTEPFMSIFLHPGSGKIYKNFKDDDYPNLLHCPFPDESYNLLRHYFLNNKKEFITMIKEEEHGGEMLNHFSHQHPLILLDSHTQQTSLIVLHNPMKKIQVLCDGCLKPITEMPFYKCSEISSCGFVLHEWCARLPSQIQHHPGHPEHVLVLVSKNPHQLLGLFFCDICRLPGNSFAYGCIACDYYVDINCAFLPKEITHEAHPGHLLSRINASSADLSKKLCNSCECYLQDCNIAFHCPSCDFYLDTECALLFPGMMRHKFDKHPLSLRYNPVENHPGDYFCEICEDKFDPKNWFYHCSSTCAQSMHPACAPLILECEKHVYAMFKRGVFCYMNVKFEGTIEIQRLHEHRLSFLQGIQSHGLCKVCGKELQYNMIFKCLKCEYSVHGTCASSFGN
ncbi:uncharacterized protein LOC111879425 [Lactuca sativa]|uniref:uncharacterized protein LOC111879425 n=1 Tax=Lactuca sativa TaxID=4236 RepID=UPI000CB62E82|nr:uncharacterized protein LOC111879425 [Lactuca sativa]XP_023731651.1 uncharacterized protein LOC111879425 [Lactuca sativa]XP_042754116.1 uncharacterized protein LOC111879425 [Lactuca sativa]